jgi:hypothetical protein
LNIPENPLFALRNKCPWFAAQAVTEKIPVQDTIHLGAKLRVRLLKRKRGIFMVMGNKIASCSDLEHLLRRVSKDHHLLRDGDVNQHDKMNYDAVERLCSPNIRCLLKEHVPGIEVNIVNQTKRVKYNRNL